MSIDFSPQVRRLRLGRELRDRRENCKLTLVQAAEQAGWSRGQLSRLERGEGKPDTAMVMDLLDLYKVNQTDRADLLDTARQAAKHGWWRSHFNTSSEQRGLAEFEAGAEALRVFNPVCVPGLLQTSDYAETRIRAGHFIEAEPSDVNATVKLRRQRQEILGKINLHVVLDEAVLLRRLSSPAVRYQQMKHLIFKAQQDRITIQILPFDRHTDDEAAAMAPFTIFEYSPPDPPMAVFDTAIGEVKQENDDDVVEHYRALYARLADAALSPEKSIAMMEALLDDI